MARNGMTHVDEEGKARMVDVGQKEPTERVAVAEGRIRMSQEALRAMVEGTAPKGDVFAVARLAGIQGAKRTSDMVPLCHPIPITGVEVEVEPEEDGVRVRATVRTRWVTGVEMEALLAVSMALMSIYDMLKAVDRGMVLEDVRLMEKRGGRSGTWKAAGS